jgi:hypothetical protein
MSVLVLCLYIGNLAGYFLLDAGTKSSRVTMTSPLNGGAGLTGKSGRKTANACDTSATETSMDTAADFMLPENAAFLIPADCRQKL